MDFQTNADPADEMPRHPLSEPCPRCAREAGEPCTCYAEEGSDELTCSYGTETRDQRIARLEALGYIVPSCPGCREWYEHPKVDPFAPRHKVNEGCQSGKRPHCTCGDCGW